MMKWWRHRRCLRRIADLEADLYLWPPWELACFAVGMGEREYRYPTNAERRNDLLPATWVGEIQHQDEEHARWVEKANQRYRRKPPTHSRIT